MSDHVSEYRREKMEKFFDFIDRDKDGYVSTDDFAHNIKYLEATGRDSEQIVKALKRNMMSWWGLFHEDAGKNGCLSKTDFVKCNAEYHADKNTGGELTKLYTLVFDVIDLDGDGKISFEELMLYYKAHDWTDENHVRDVFTKMDQNADGFITRDEFIEANIQHWLSEEPGTGFMY